MIGVYLNQYLLLSRWVFSIAFHQPNDRSIEKSWGKRGKSKKRLFRNLMKSTKSKVCWGRICVRSIRSVKFLPISQFCTKLRVNFQEFRFWKMESIIKYLLIIRGKFFFFTSKKSKLFSLSKSKRLKNWEFNWLLAESDL